MDELKLVLLDLPDGHLSKWAMVLPPDVPPVGQGIISLIEKLEQAKGGIEKGKIHTLSEMLGDIIGMCAHRRGTNQEMLIFGLEYRTDDVLEKIEKLDIEISERPPPCTDWPLAQMVVENFDSKTKPKYSPPKNTSAFNNNRPQKRIHKTQHRK